MSSNRKNAPGFGRDEMTALIGGGLDERLVRATSKPAKTSQMADMSTAQTAAWLAQQHQKKVKKTGAAVRHRTNKTRKYHELLKEQQGTTAVRPIQQLQRQSAQESSSDSESAAEQNIAPLQQKRRVVEPKIVIRTKSEQDRGSRSDSQSDSDSQEFRSPARRIRRRSSSGSSSSDDSVDERRRQRLLRLRKQQEEEGEDNGLTEPAAKTSHDDEPPMLVATKAAVSIAGHSSSIESSNSDSDESSSESEDISSSSEDEVVLAKPLYVPKHKRGAQQAPTKLDDFTANTTGKERWEEKQAQESRVLVQKAVEADKHSKVDVTDDPFACALNAVPDDDDDRSVGRMQDEWEVREVVRLVRTHDQKEAERLEREETMRRRKMTDEERMAEDREQNLYRRPGEQGEVGSISYGQRYYHKGAFYMDESEWDEKDIRHKAKTYATAATGEDKVDRRALPDVMKVKKFGRANQNLRYKGLAAEDTTDKSLDVIPLARKKGKMDF